MFFSSGSAHVLVYMLTVVGLFDTEHAWTRGVFDFVMDLCLAMASSSSNRSSPCRDVLFSLLWLPCFVLFFHFLFFNRSLYNNASDYSVRHTCPLALLSQDFVTNGTFSH